MTVLVHTNSSCKRTYLSACSPPLEGIHLYQSISVAKARCHRQGEAGVVAVEPNNIRLFFTQFWQLEVQVYCDDRFDVWEGTSLAGLWMASFHSLSEKDIPDVFLVQRYQSYQIRANPMTSFKCIYYLESTISNTAVPRFPWGLFPPWILESLDPQTLYIKWCSVCTELMQILPHT